jgi:hypothetical protein
MRNRRANTAALVLTIALAVPAFAAPRTINEGPIDRVIRVIKKIFTPATTMEQPIVPIPGTTIN